MKYILVLFLNFLMVGAKAAQQINVVRGYYLMIPVAGFILAAGEVIVYGSVAITAVKGDYLDAFFLIIALWIGAVLGCWLSMHLHEKYRRKNE